MAGGDEAERDRLEAAPSRAFERASHFARWKPDWLADEAVHCEPVWARISLQTGNLSGKYCRSGPIATFAAVQ
jgi:hypothetical protein